MGGIDRIRLRHRWLAALPLLFAMGCQKEWYGTGTVYVWNGSPQKAEVELGGRSPETFSLRSHSGKALREVIAGPYGIRVKLGGDGWQQLAGGLERSQLLLINVGAEGCIARTDVVGMYRKGTRPVRLLEVYRGEPVIEIADLIHLLPGESLPPGKPKGALTFQRLSVVPCEIADKRHEIETLVKKQR